MDVLIVESNELVGSMLADTLNTEAISAMVASDEEAQQLPPHEAPRLVITGINRGPNEDMTGLKMVSAMRRKWPQLCALYLSALWPARLRPEMLTDGERLLTKPVPVAKLTRTVWDLLDLGLCGGGKAIDRTSLPDR